MMPEILKCCEKKSTKSSEPKCSQVEKSILHKGLDRPSVLDTKEPFCLLIGDLPGQPDTHPPWMNGGWWILYEETSDR